jgi:hypothetical protein
MRNEADSGWRIADSQSRSSRVLNVCCSFTGRPVLGRHMSYGDLVLSAIRYPLSASVP